MVIMTKSRIFLPAILLLAMTACTPPTATKLYNPDVATRPKSAGTNVDAPPVVFDESQPSRGQSHGNSGGHTAKTITPTASSESPAVLALMQEADASTASGRLDNAAATLERAIRIQPRNAQLWHKLAVVRLQQHQPGLAEDLAKKSNILAKDNKSLVRKNWSIIADARRQKGDGPGASEADAKAKR